MERTWRWFGKKDKITLAQLPLCFTKDTRLASCL